MPLHPMKLRRMQAQMTQFELARQLGVSESLVSRWETWRGRPDPRLAQAAASILGGSTVELFPRVNP